MSIVLDPDRTMVYIFAATVEGSDKESYLANATQSDSKERREFLDMVLRGKDKELRDDRIVVIPTRRWLSGSVTPFIRYSAAACTQLVMLANEYLIHNGYVMDQESLEALGNGVCYDEWYKLVYIAYAVDEPTGRAVYKF